MRVCVIVCGEETVYMIWVGHELSFPYFHFNLFISSLPFCYSLLTISISNIWLSSPYKAGQQLPLGGFGTFSKSLFFLWCRSWVRLLKVSYLALKKFKSSDFLLVFVWYELSNLSLQFLKSCVLRRPTASAISQHHLLFLLLGASY